VTEKETNALIKPYNWYWHPCKTWLDMFVGLIIWFVFPMQKIAKLPATKSNAETTKQTDDLRSFKRKMSAASGKKALAKWEVTAKCAIVQHTYSVARKPLLKEWGLYKESLEEKSPAGDIEVVIRFPSSVMEQTKDADPSEKNDFGCVVVEKLGLENLPLEVPVVLHFFGGGMTVGVHSDDEGLELAQQVCELASKSIIFAGVCYSQSPDHPFPVAVEETLTVVSHFLDKLPDRSIHLSGISAGANLAAVATMEMQRKYPGRISTSSIICAMLNPAANTLSYYLNSNSFFPSTEWLRWCWRAYLELPDAQKQGDSTMQQLETTEARLELGSNRSAWEDSPFNKGVLTRLVNPTVDMPGGLNEPNAPKFLVMTNEGDPLRDDGAELAEKLKSSGADLRYLEHPGSHWIGTGLDKEHYASLVSNWREILFSK
jgi:acetyl esterase/lipase